jgi:hypothetical protein
MDRRPGIFRSWGKWDPLQYALLLLGTVLCLYPVIRFLIKLIRG